MAVFEPWAFGDATPNPEFNSVTTTAAVFNTNGMVEIVSVKAPPEFGIRILNLVIGARGSVLSPFLQPLPRRCVC